MHGAFSNRKDNPVKGSETSWDRTRSRRFPTGKDRPAKGVGGMYREKRKEWGDNFADCRGKSERNNYLYTTDS